jgi:aminoglycoside N3'-acetyltransferase
VLDPDGSERWKSFKDLDLDDQHFSKLADDVAPLIKQHLRDGFLATARCLLLPIKEAVDAAVEVAVEKAGKKPPAEAPEPPVDAKPAAASPQVDVS